MKKVLCVISLVGLVGCGETIEYVSQPVEVVKNVDHYFESKALYVYCNSIDFQYEAVEVNIPDNAQNVSIKLYSQVSDSSCLRNESYGLINEYTIYCQDGCRGRFKLSYELEVIK